MATKKRRPTHSRRIDAALIRDLEERAHRCYPESVELARIASAGLAGIARERLRRETGIELDALAAVLDRLAAAHQLAVTPAGLCLAAGAWADLERRIASTVAAREPLPRGELAAALPKNVETDAIEFAIERLVAAGRVVDAPEGIRAATACERNAQDAMAELEKFRHRIDAAALLDSYDDAPEDARLARSFLEGAAQAIGEGDAGRAFVCGIAMRELLIRLEGAESVRRGTRNDRQAIKLENRDRKSRDVRIGSRRAEPADVAREVESRRQTGMPFKAAYFEVGKLLHLTSGHIKNVYLAERRKNLGR